MNCNNMLQSNLQPAQKSFLSRVCMSWRDSVTAAYNSCNSYRILCVKHEALQAAFILGAG